MWGSVIMGGVAIVGGMMASSSNKKATQAQIEATEKAEAIRQQNIPIALEYLHAGAGAAASMFSSFINTGPPTFLIKPSEAEGGTFTSPPVMNPDGTVNEYESAKQFASDTGFTMTDHAPRDPNIVKQEQENTDNVARQEAKALNQKQEQYLGEQWAAQREQLSSSGDFGQMMEMDQWLEDAKKNSDGTMAGALLTVPNVQDKLAKADKDGTSVTLADIVPNGVGSMPDEAKIGESILEVNAKNDGTGGVTYTRDAVNAEDSPDGVASTATDGSATTGNGSGSSTPGSTTGSSQTNVDGGGGSNTPNTDGNTNSSNYDNFDPETDIPEGFGADKSPGFERSKDVDTSISTNIAETAVDQSNEAFVAGSGGMGGEAQARFFQNFEDSPGVRFLRERGLKSIDRNASAQGGLISGNREKARIKFAQGMAVQSLDQQMGWLNTAANRELDTTKFVSGIVERAGINSANLVTGAAAAGAESAERVGDINATGALRSGQIKQDTIGTVGGIVGDYLDERNKD